MNNCVCTCPETFYAYNSVVALAEFRRHVTLFDSRLQDIHNNVNTPLVNIVDSFRRSVAKMEDWLLANKYQQNFMYSGAANMMVTMQNTVAAVYRGLGPRRQALRGLCDEMNAIAFNLNLTISRMR